MITCIKEYRKYIKEDLEMRGLTSPPFLFSIRNPIIHFQIMLRRVELFQNYNKSVFGNLFRSILGIRYKRLSSKLGFTVPPNTCGPGLVLVHWGGCCYKWKGKNWCTM